MAIIKAAKTVAATKATPNKPRVVEQPKSPMVHVASGRKAAQLAKTPKGHPAPHEIHSDPSSGSERHVYTDGSSRILRSSHPGHTKHVPKPIMKTTAAPSKLR